jgi:hypothetical protein
MVDKNIASMAAMLGMTTTNQRDHLVEYIHLHPEAYLLDNYAMLLL